MYLNKESKIIFFHVPKNAGTSVHDSLVKKFGNSDFSSKLLDISHITPHHLRVLYDIDLTRYNLYMVSRNPYDSEISYYRYMQKNTAHRYHRIIVNMNFQEYIDWRVLNPGVSQKDYYIESMKVFRNENVVALYNHFSIVKDVIRNSSGKRLRKYYTEFTADIVYELRRCDFDQFEYARESWSLY